MVKPLDCLAEKLGASGQVPICVLHADMTQIRGQHRQQLFDRLTGSIPEHERAYRKTMAIIPPAELSTLFRQPDYSGNGRSGALFPGGSRERVRISGGIIRGASTAQRPAGSHRDGGHKTAVSRKKRIHRDPAVSISISILRVHSVLVSRWGSSPYPGDRRWPIEVGR